MDDNESYLYSVLLLIHLSWRRLQITRFVDHHHQVFFNHKIYDDNNNEEFFFLSNVTIIHMIIYCAENSFRPLTLVP